MSQSEESGLWLIDFRNRYHVRITQIFNNCNYDYDISFHFYRKCIFLMTIGN